MKQFWVKISTGPLAHHGGQVKFVSQWPGWLLEFQIPTFCIYMYKMYKDMC